MTNPFPLGRTSYADTRSDRLAVLWLVREYGPMTLTQLLESAYRHPAPWDGRKRLFVNGILHYLVDAGLVEAEPALTSPDTQFLDAHTFRVSPRLKDVQDLFSVGLTHHIRRLDQLDRYVQAYPVFGKPRPLHHAGGLDVFVMMPFAPEMRRVYDPHIRAVTDRLKLTCERGDDFFTAHNILQDIWSAIYHATVCIAECTGRNPNVFYEIGMAHTCGTPCILLAQSKDDIPFDIGQMRVIIYEDTPPGRTTLETSLEKALRTTLRLPDTAG
ncbi:MAG: hypothetical protein IT323_22420 [Anaerolineae bacterium]|nr:hypothetical protein [Anaerolineae bacterium]